MLMSCKREKDNVSDNEKSFGIQPCDPVHFVIPVGFRGQIEITENKTNGVVPAVKSNTIEIQVPKNGRVVLKDWAPLFCEHHESASYTDGTPLPDPNMVPAGGTFPHDEVAFWSLGTEMGTKYPQETLIYFVGTKDELNRLK